MQHKIRFISDEAMPEGHDFVFAQVGDDHAIFYRESALSPAMLEDSWAAYRALCESPRRPSPQMSLRSVS